jgi:trehalose 6-phosphate synthase
MKKWGRLLVVSNRLPVTLDTTEDGPRLRSSGGGLVTALMPILRDCRGYWVGWTGGDSEDISAEVFKNWELSQNYSFVPVFLTAAEKASYYRGFSNEIIWPLFHSLPSRCQFDSLYWDGYCKVNEKFADAVGSVAHTNDFIWVHDYHLMMLAHALRRRALTHPLAYFHHIPFPSPDIFETLPWREEVLRALLQFDLLGFQTVRDRRNFIGCLRRCLNAVRVCHIGETHLVSAEGQSVRLGTFPISIDYDEFEADSVQSETIVASEAIRKNLNDSKIILGVDRLDYTKGVPERLTAFQKLIELNPDLRGRVTMIQIVVPSREDIPEYKQLQLRIEALVGKINGKFGTPGWVPVHYLYRCVSRTELISFYRAADVAMVTPLKDGMNLVAKEFCASRSDNRGVLLLSEFAGAAEELRCGALLVNPHHTEKVAVLLEKALGMDEAEQEMRMAKMRSHIRTHDVFHWFESFNAEGAFGGFNVSVGTSSDWDIPTTAVAGD